jgi:hypothetical protein
MKLIKIILTKLPQVFDGSNSAAPQLAKWCGYTAPLIAESTGSSLYMTMNTDFVDPGTGLKGFTGYYFYHK